jgi:hypothetical protein
VILETPAKAPKRLPLSESGGSFSMGSEADLDQLGQVVWPKEIFSGRINYLTLFLPHLLT